MQAGQKVADAKIAVELNPAVTDDAFKVAAADYQRVEPLPDTLPEQVEKLADGVYVIQNVAGQNQNTMAVEFKDYIVAVEAPGSSDGADQVIERIKQTIPNKPIRYVVMTHHHGDHIGGLRSFIAEGATVITTQANRRTVEEMADATAVGPIGKESAQAAVRVPGEGQARVTRWDPETRTDRYRPQSAREGNGDRLPAEAAHRLPGRPVLQAGSTMLRQVRRRNRR